ncbi:MAG: hypothetical protein F6K32_26995 [Desertifilum sp. SIO1I2]|nr:hypothetical protein [Desertifilum sp. SIO1I2]
MKLPSPTDWYFNTPLYEDLNLTDLESDKLNYYLSPLQANSLSMDVYCVQCKNQSIFKTLDVSSTSRSPENFSQTRILTTTLTCARDSSHKIYFLFLYHVLYDPLQKKLIKIGQNPSIADLKKYSIEQYKKVLGEEKYREFSRAIGLFSHGVGIGSFVYLRRIFEDLIEESYHKAKANLCLDEIEYRKKRMDEKIQALNQHLPNFLVENRKIYSVLSKGIHQLSEKDCLEHFLTLQASIEIILEEKLADLNKQKKEVAVAEKLAQLHQKLQEQDKQNDS